MTNEIETMNKEAIEAYEYLYELLKEVTGNENPLPNNDKTIRATLERPQVDLDTYIAPKTMVLEGWSSEHIEGWNKCLYFLKQKYGKIYAVK